MKIIVYIVVIFSLLIQACGQSIDQQKVSSKDSISEIVEIQEEDFKIIKEDGQTIKSRFLPPKGYRRIESEEGSFAEYLRTLPLQPHNAAVMLYDGGFKSNDDAYIAVVDLKIGERDLHQCADAIMRLRAEYLWNNEMYDKIHFNFTNGFRVDYSEWMMGKRIRVKGNSSYWVNSTSPSNSYEDFWQYLETIFMYAGTLSLSKELNPADFNEMQIGDIFIKGGSPGHAIIVVDMAIDSATNKNVFMLAQSYMPAQEIQILSNLNNPEISPWYSSDVNFNLDTPEWSFYLTDLKRFEE